MNIYLANFNRVSDIEIMNIFHYTTFLQYHMFAYHCYDNKNSFDKNFKISFS